MAEPKSARYASKSGKARMRRQLGEQVSQEFRCLGRMRLNGLCVGCGRGGPDDAMVDLRHAGYNLISQ